MILKILLFATCGILSVLAVGGKTGAKEGYKISPSGLDALRRVRSTLGKNTPYPVVTRTWGRNLESFCLPAVVCFDPIGQMGTSCWCTQCNSELKRDTNTDSWYHRTFRLYGLQSAHLLFSFNYVCPNKQCVVKTCVAHRSKLSKLAATGRFTDEERELWVELYHAYRKRRNVFQAMHPRWMERTNEEGIHARTMDQLRKFKPTAQRCGLIGKDDEEVDTVDSQDATQPAKTATPSQRPPTTSAASSPSTSSTLSNPSPPYPAITSVAMNVHGPQPTFTASPASARPPPMAPHVAPSLSGFSSFGQVPPMLNVNDMVAQRLRYELQQVNADIQQYTQHATFAVLSPQQLQHWNGLVERSVLLHAQLQNMGSS